MTCVILKEKKSYCKISYSKSHFGKNNLRFSNTQLITFEIINLNMFRESFDSQDIKHFIEVILMIVIFCMFSILIFFPSEMVCRCFNFCQPSCLDSFYLYSDNFIKYTSALVRNFSICQEIVSTFTLKKIVITTKKKLNAY